MSLVEAISPAFGHLYRKLRLAEVHHTVLGAPAADGMTRPELSYLLSTASRLALDGSGESPESAYKSQLAYDVAVRASRHMGEFAKSASAISGLILSRLGNFPAKTLLAGEYGEVDDITDDPFLRAECLVRGIENSRDDISEDIRLTDFQVRLLDTLQSERNVSISAPTSAGKSFALEQHLVRLLRSTKAVTAVYIVPTRALIRQVSFDLIDLVRQNSLYATVLSSPIPPQKRDNDRAQHLIFVLTQERFATLLAEATPTLSIDAIIVDEAQEISKEKRGQTLERVIQIALQRYPTTKVFFSSPLRSNPEYLLELFRRSGEASSHFTEFRSPVSQNLIFVKPVLGVPKRAKVTLKLDDGDVEAGTLDLPFKFRNSYMGKLAHYFTKEGETSIVYCNRPSSADKQAEDIAETIQEPVHDEELDDFAAFLEGEVHRLYKLPELIRKGVSFHYANIPQIVRGKIEELVKARKITFVCCTSTLLQGMNLPAKNIFVEDPKTGQGEEGAISRGDFWNLIGRAGRLKMDFTGNVFCVFGKDWKIDELIEDRFVPIESAQQIAIRERTKELAMYAKTPPEGMEGGALWAVQAFASIYADRVMSDTRLSASVSEPDVLEAAMQVDSAADDLRTAQTLPDEIYARNLYVHPKTLEELADYFRAHPDISSLIPVLPVTDRGNSRLRTIMEIIELYFLKTGTKSYIYYAFLASMWMQGKPLRDILKGRLTYKGLAENAENVNKEVRGLFEEIEKQIRYVYVKYTAIYNQVLAAVLAEKGYSAQANNLVPLHLFLEFGASDRTAINLMGLGLSRTSALLLRGAASLPRELDVNQCREYVDGVNLERALLPRVCKSEIQRVRSKSS